jgi:hypothetical protein
MMNLDKFLARSVGNPKSGNVLTITMCDLSTDQDNVTTITTMTIRSHVLAVVDATALEVIHPLSWLYQSLRTRLLIRNKLLQHPAATTVWYSYHSVT